MASLATGADAPPTEEPGGGAESIASPVTERVDESVSQPSHDKEEELLVEKEEDSTDPATCTVKNLDTGDHFHIEEVDQFVEKPTSLPELPDDDGEGVAKKKKGKLLKRFSALGMEAVTHAMVGINAMKHLLVDEEEVECDPDYIQLAIPETGAAHDGSHMLYSIFVWLPHMKRSWMVSRRFNDFVALDCALKEADIDTKYDGKTPFEVQLPKKPWFANKTDIHLTRNRRRALEAYLWERVYETSVKRCKELAIFLSPNLVFVDDSSIDGVNGIYCETEIMKDGAFVYARMAPSPSISRFELKREVQFPDKVYSVEQNEDDKKGVYFWVLECQLQWGGSIKRQLYGVRSDEKQPPVTDWTWTEQLPSKFADTSISCLYKQHWLCWDQVLEGIRVLEPVERGDSIDSMLNDFVKPTFKSGNLKKQGRYRKNWKMRVFVLDFDTALLEYYDMDGASLRGSLNVQGASVEIEDENPLRFTITTTGEHGSRVLRLESTSAAATEDWAKHVQRIATLDLQLSQKLSVQGKRGRNSWKGESAPVLPNALEGSSQTFNAHDFTYNE
mgnify:CR=1 FL=1